MHVGARFIDGAVDEALDVRRRRIIGQRRAVERELENVLRFDQLRAARAREQVALGMQRMSHADVSISIDHALRREDAVGDDEVVDALLEGA